MRLLTVLIYVVFNNSTMLLNKTMIEKTPTTPPRLRSASHIRLKDIAKACGFSSMTVSRALKDTGSVNPATRDKVTRIAREMGYVPNRLASGLAGQKTLTVGVVIPDIDHSIFPAILKGIESVLSQQGYRLFLCCSYNRPGKEYQEVQALLERRVDGIIMAPASTAESREGVHHILTNGCPLVLIDRTLPDVSADSVVFDDFEGARSAVEHLLAQGFSRIAHIGGPQNVWTCDERLRGYTQALRDAGIKVRSEWIIRGGLTVADGEASMERLLGRTPHPDAIFCVNDPTALGVFKVLKRNGISVPEQMAITGFSDIMEAELLEVPLTTVFQDPDMAGRLSADLLLARMTDGSQGRDPVHQVIKTRLVIRKSAIKCDINAS